MKKLLLYIIILLSYLFANAVLANTSQDNEYRLALVIGNSHYQSSPLSNPVNDANDIAKKLKSLGFKVILKLDANEKQMIQAIRKFGHLLRDRRGVGLFYYAGHGMQVQGENFLLPIGADILEEDEIMYESINVNRVMEKMERANSRINIVILDACRNNPFERSFRSASRGLAQMKSPSGTLIAFATEPGNVALDGNERNGIYTQNLLKHMDAENLDIGRMFRKVRSDVRSVTNNSQTPWESSSLTGDFYFNRVVKTKSKEAPVTEKKGPEKSAIINTANIELEFWHSVEKVGTVEYYQSYLANFPKGYFVIIAKMRIEELERSKTKILAKQRQPVPEPVTIDDNVASIVTEANNDEQQQKIMRLLKQAQKSEAELRLTTPENSNAVYFYQQILALDPKSQIAQQGIKHISDKYLSWTRSAIAREEFSKARTYFQRAQSITPDSSEINSMRSLIQKNSMADSNVKLSNQSVLIAKPLKGQLARKNYLKASPKVLDVLAQTLSAHMKKVKVLSKQQSRSKNLRAARRQGAGILIIPDILHWEDRNTLWSGRPDKVKLKLTIVNVRTGKTLKTKVFEQSGEWSFKKLSSDTPDSLLVEPLKVYFNRVISRASL